MKKRKQNEKEFQKWEELEDGGRLYIKVVEAGDGNGKKACYEKIAAKYWVVLT